MYRDEDGGPTSKHAPGLKSKSRKESRRVLHKSARNKIKEEIRKESTH